MAASLFIGPAYTLRERKAAMQSAVNLYLSGLETPDKAPFIMQSAPGLSVFATPTGVCRGAIKTPAGRCFVVYSATLYEVSAAGVGTSRGALGTETGEVDMAVGLTQLVLVDGPNGYVLTLSDNTFTQINNEGWYGSYTVEFVNNYFCFIRPDTQQEYISAINDALTFDALDFSSAERSPDKLVGEVSLNSTRWLFGQTTTEFFFLSAGGDYPFVSNGQGVLEVGLVAAHSARKIADSIIWIGRTEEGEGIVYRSAGYGGVRVSTQAIEEALRGSSDLSAAVAYTYQQDGQHFWCVNAPGLTSTWCYELTTGAWHERAEVDVNGKWKAFRVTHHVYAHGKHLVGAADGNLYEMSPTVYTLAGDPLVRERVSPHSSDRSLRTMFYDLFALDCSTGGRGQRAITTGLNESLDTRRDDYKVELSFADWKPHRALQFCSPILRTLGYVGDTIARLVWRANVLGYGRDRVWRVRYSGNSPFSIISADVTATQGSD